MPDIL